MKTIEEIEMADNSLDGLQRHQAKLASIQRRISSYNGILTASALILPLLGVWFAWYLYNKDSQFWILAVVYSLMPLTMLPFTRARLRQIENDIQELDFRIDLQQFEVNKREVRAEKILRLNDFQLRRYYDLNIKQNTWVFGLGVFCIILGIAVIGTTLYLVIQVAQTFETQVITAVLGSIGAILSNFIAVIYLRMNTAATENLTAFHSRLVETHQLLLGNLLASRIDNDDKRFETLSQLSLRLMEKNKD